MEWLRLTHCTELRSQTPPERTRPTATRIATVADAVPLPCAFATASTPLPVPVTPFSPHRLVAQMGPAG
jgi:hypothetical protein